MTVQETLTKFELYLDDGTELSTQEEVDLFDKIYQKVCMYRPWEFLKKTVTGTLSTTVPYISLPSDFSYLTENNQYTDNNIGIDNTNASKVIFVGTNYDPYKVVNFSDRRQYRNQTNICWIDMVNSRLYFAVQPTSALSYEFDYMSFPPKLTTTGTPLIPSRFHDIIYHGMCADDYMIQQSDKLRSYQKENELKYQDYLSQMAYWNASLINN